MSRSDGFNSHARDANTKEEALEQNMEDSGVSSKNITPEVEEQEYDKYQFNYNPPGMGQSGHFSKSLPPQEDISESIDSSSFSEEYGHHDSYEYPEGIETELEQQLWREMKEEQAQEQDIDRGEDISQDI